MPPALSTPLDLPPSKDEKLSALYQTIAQLYAAGKYAEAVPVAQEYVADIQQRVDDPEGLAFANAISLLSRLYQVQGKFEDAEPLLQRSVAIFKRNGGAEAELAAELDALAQLYDSQGEFKKAEPLFASALALSEKNSAADPRRYGRALNDLAWVYLEQSRYAEAEPLASQALDVLAKAFGNKDSDYGCALDTVAKLYEGQNRKTQAELFYRQALAVLEGALGPESVSTAATRENLGGLLKSLGKLGEAEQLLNQALATKERVLGTGHPNLAKTLSQLGELYRLQGKPEQADKLFKRAFAIQNGALKEIRVFFVTDRQREQDGNAVGFGNVRSEALTFGRATVVVPKPQATPAPVRAAERTEAEVDTSGNIVVPGTQSPADALPPLVSTTELTHLAISGVTASSEVDLMQSAALELGTHSGEALVFVHGYNVTFENALRRAAQISYDTKFDGPTFLFSWAAGGRLSDYVLDIETTELSVKHLSAFVKAIVSRTKIKKIHFIAHSMGNLVLLHALEKMAADPSLRPVIGEIIDAAPDVNADLFTELVDTIKGNGGSFTLYASRADWALWASGKLRGLPRAGFIGDKALIVPGVETIDVTDAGTGYFSLNHDVYASNPVLVEDMRGIFKDHRHPPDQRTKAFEPVVANDGTYWRYRRAEANAAPPPEPERTPSAPPPLVQAPSPPPMPPVVGRAPPVTLVAPTGSVSPPPSPASPPGAPASETTDTKAAAVPVTAPAESAAPPVTGPPEAAPQVPAATAATPPPAASDATAAITPPPANAAQRKKRIKRDFDPEWNTKILH